MMGVNQTIMMALALVVLATFIGAQGLGSDIWVSIKKLESELLWKEVLRSFNGNHVR